MRRLFSTLMIGMFAFGFCVALSGCGEEPAADPAPATEGGDAGDAGDAEAGSDAE